MDRVFFVGVDGGGTRCRARIRDGAGTILGEGEAGPANACGRAATAMAAVITASRRALAAAGLDPDALGTLHAGLGLAGVAQAQDRAAFLDLPHPFHQITLDSDAAAACLGAFAGRDGGIVIAGTGSVGIALLDGHRHSIGGHGLAVSDDGSGAWIGQQAVRQALWAHDGLQPMTALAAAVIERLGGDTDAVVAWTGTARPADYGALAPLVFDGVRSGDPAAAAIVAAAAGHIARLAARLRELGAPRLCLVGGVARHLEPWLPADLRAILAPPLGDAQDGAILMARRTAAADPAGGTPRP